MGAIALLGLHPLSAEDLFQIANSGNGWNSADYWGSDPISGNNYFSLPSGGLQNSFVADGVQWAYATGIGTVRTSPDPGSNSTFAGDSLTLLANTRLLDKVRNGSTSTVNLVFGGGFFMVGNNAPGGSSTLAGTLSFAEGTNLGAIAVNRGQPAALTVSSTLIGGSGDTLQLILFSEGGISGVSSIVFTGDLSDFSGTLYVGTSPTNNGANPSSFYSVQSSSASATLNIDTGTFVSGGNTYHLDNDVTFGSLIVGGTPLDAGTYYMTDLNTFAGGSFFNGAGSITVVPEPSTLGLCLLALGAGFFSRRFFGERPGGLPRSF